jgi:hypothetical protein
VLIEAPEADAKEDNRDFQRRSVGEKTSERVFIRYVFQFESPLSSVFVVSEPFKVLSHLLPKALPIMNARIAKNISWDCRKLLQKTFNGIAGSFEPGRGVR